MADLVDKAGQGKDVPNESASVREAREYAQKLLGDKGQDFTAYGSNLPPVPEKEGWTRRWVIGDNVPYRLSLGYRMVSKKDVNLTNTVTYGNSEMGDGVSIPAKNEGNDGKPAHLYLMEIPTEIANKLIFSRVTKPNQAIDNALKGGRMGDPDPENTYIPGGKDGVSGRIEYKRGTVTLPQ